MTCTILLTGANGSLAIHSVRYLLKHHIDKYLLLTVRNTSDEDVNTAQLRKLLSEFPDARFSIRQLDLSSLSAVKKFTAEVAVEIDHGGIPKLGSIICNAYYWNLTKDVETTADGYEKTFQINYVAHAVLVLQLLNSFAPSGGRIVLFSSDAHWPGKNSLEKYPPAIPSDIDQLVKPGPDEPKDNFGKGFQRYAVSKLATVLWMYALNQHLEKDPVFANITAVAINPGNLSDSRALRVNTPAMLRIMSKFVIQPMRPLLRFTDPTMRTAGEAGVDVAKLAANEAYPGERGYFTLLEKDTSSPVSLDANLQQTIWAKTLEWADITKENTKLPA